MPLRVLTLLCIKLHWQKETKLLAFLDIFYSLTGDTRGLQKKALEVSSTADEVSELSWKKKKLHIELYDLKFEYFKLKFNISYSPCGDMPN